MWQNLSSILSLSLEDNPVVKYFLKVNKGDTRTMTIDLDLNPLSANPTKWPNILELLFDNFVRLVLKGLNKNFNPF